MRMQEPTAKHEAEQNPANKGSAHCSSYSDGRSLKEAFLDPTQVSSLQAPQLQSDPTEPCHSKFSVICQNEVKLAISFPILRAMNCLKARAMPTAVSVLPQRLKLCLGHTGSHHVLAVLRRQSQSTST